MNALWILIVLTPNVTSYSLEFVPMPKEQCLAALKVMEPYHRKIGMACVGPDGQIVEMGE
ncbi:hypothetical protein [Profundibacter sp.]